MKFNPNSIIEGCVSTDATRCAINNVHLDTKDEGAPKLIATNGRMLACVPVEIEAHDVAGAISPEAIKASRKLARKGNEATIEANGALALANGQSFRRPNKPDDVDFHAYPNWRQIMIEPGTAFKVSLDAELLLKLAKALSANGETIVTLSFDAPCSPIHVKGGILNGVGILMPCRMSYEAANEAARKADSALSPFGAYDRL